MQQHQIIIAGAGPAGSSCSLFLGQKEIPHLLLDKAVFPRDKVCGDALSGKVVEVLNLLNPAIVEGMADQPDNFMDSWGVVFGAPNGKELSIPFRSSKSTLKSAPGFISPRLSFDHFLLQKTDNRYTELWQETELIHVEKKKDKILVQVRRQGKEEELLCDLLIDAMGDRSVVNRKLAAYKKEDAHYCAGIRAYYRGVSNFQEGNFIELHFLEELLPGYFWIFPLPNGMANVGAGMLSSSVSARKVNLREAMLKAIAQNPRIRERFAGAELVGKIQGWGLPLGSKKRKLSGDHFMLCGDAASLIDPFTGEGIGNALYSGMLAAETAAACLKNNRFDEHFMHQYDERIYTRLWDELKLSHTLQNLCRYPWLFNFVVNKAHKSKTLRETISCMFDDIDLRSRFRDPLFYLKMLVNK